MDSLKKKAINAIKWKTYAQFADYFLKFTLGVILARLLSPEEFGLVALVLVVTELSNFIINGGFSASLIQNRNIDDKDLSTVFYINIVLGISFTLLFFFGAPLFVRFYEEPRLLSITKVLSFSYTLNSLTVVQKAYFIRRIDFKQISIINIIVQLTSGIIGIVLAFAGFGYWSLVWKRISQSIIQACLYFYYSGWKPARFFSIKIFKKHWGFSNKILVYNFFRQLTEKIDLIIVGKYFNAQDLGIFERGKNYGFLPMGLIASITNSVLFPVFSRLQDNKTVFLNDYIKIYRLLTFLFLPLVILLFYCAHEFVYILVGEKWMGAVPYLQIFSIGSFMYIESINRLDLLSSLGYPHYSSTFSIIELITKPLIIIGLLIILNISMKVIALVFVSYIFIRFIYASIFLSKKLNVSTLKLIFANYKELLSLLMSFFITIAVINILKISSVYLVFGSKIFIFYSLYIIIGSIFLKETYRLAKKLIKNVVRKG